MSGELGSSIEDSLESRAREIMDRLYYTYKTHYTMAEYYEKGMMLLNFFVAIGTAILVFVLTWGIYSQEVMISIAAVVTILSWIQAVLGLGKKSVKHFNTADRYHSLHQDFEHFVEVDLEAGALEDEEIMQKFESLDRQRKEMNEITPRTTNFWHKIFNYKKMFVSVL